MRGGPFEVEKSDDGRQGVRIVIPAALVSALAASGVMFGFSPASRLASDPMARPDPYTGTMHRAYAEYIDARFAIKKEKIAALQREVDRLRESCVQGQKELREEIRDKHVSGK